MNPESAITDVVREIRERHGHLAVSRGVPEQLAARRAATHESLPPWWPDRLSSGMRVVELAGPPSCGKLSLALLWLAALPDRGLIAVVDTGRAFYPPAAASAGIDLERLIVVRPPGPREAIEAVTLLAGCSGFDSILWPLDRRARPNGVVAMKLAHAAGRSQTRIMTLLERPARAEWTGLASVDVRLAVARHRWRWVDGELVGVEMTVRSDRARGIKANDWSFTLETHGATRIVESGARVSVAPGVHVAAAAHQQAV